MYIRTHVTKNENSGKKYTTYKLVESYRTPNGPRQRIVADLGDLSYLDKGKLKELANRIEQIINGFSYDNPLFPKDEEIERLAYDYAEKIRLNTISETTVADIPPMGGLSEQEIWDIYSMLNDVESTFRTLKGELRLRPAYHVKGISGGWSSFYKRVGVSSGS